MNVQLEGVIGHIQYSSAERHRPTTYISQLMYALVPIDILNWNW